MTDFDTGLQAPPEPDAADPFKHPYLLLAPPKQDFPPSFPLRAEEVDVLSPEGAIALLRHLRAAGLPDEKGGAAPTAVVVRVGLDPLEWFILTLRSLNLLDDVGRLVGLAGEPDVRWYSASTPLRSVPAEVLMRTRGDEDGAERARLNVGSRPKPPVHFADILSGDKGRRNKSAGDEEDAIDDSQP